MHTIMPTLRRSASDIAAYENQPVLHRYSKEFGGTIDDAERCFRTLKQFLTACSISNGDRVASKAIDNMWHTFILFTRDYKGFCEEYLGRFVHHTPSERLGISCSQVTRTIAEDLFGIVDEELWPKNHATGDCESSSCDCCPLA